MRRGAAIAPGVKKIGPKGGKIVGYEKTDGDPIYARKAPAVPIAARKMAMEWAADSSSSKGAAQMRVGAAHLVGRKLSQEEIDRVSRSWVAKPYRMRGLYEKEIENAHSNAKVVAQVAHASQHAHEETTTLYRGIRDSQGDALREAIARGDKSIRVRLDHISSFTEDHVQAGGHANYDWGLVIRVQVPRSSIVASHRVVPMMGKEVVIATKGEIEINAKDCFVVDTHDKLHHATEWEEANK